MKIALTGGIACGKSLVAQFLNECGVETIDADDIVHELIPDPVERRRLAKLVFADESARQALESRIHPLVRAKIDTFLGACPQNLNRFSGDRPRIRLAIIPLLFETHWDRDYDIICCVTAERATQIARMMTTRGYTRAEAEARLAAQMPVGMKAEKSQYVIENNGSAEELKCKVASFVDWLKRAIG